MQAFKFSGECHWQGAAPAAAAAFESRSHESGTIPAAGARRTVWHRDVHARPEVPCSESSRVRVFKMEKMTEDVQVTSRCSLVARDKAPKLHAGAGQGGPRPVGPSQ